MLNARIQIRILGKWWQLFTIHLESLTLGIVGQNYHSHQLTPFRRHSVAMWGLWCPFSMRGSWQENTHDNPNPQVSLTPHSVGPAESRFTCSSICNWVTLASRVAGNPSLKHVFSSLFQRSVVKSCQSTPNWNWFLKAIQAGQQGEHLWSRCSHGLFRLIKSHRCPVRPWDRSCDFARKNARYDSWCPQSIAFSWCK